MLKTIPIHEMPAYLANHLLHRNSRIEFWGDVSDHGVTTERHYMAAVETTSSSTLVIIIPLDGGQTQSVRIDTEPEATRERYLTERLEHILRFFNLTTSCSLDINDEVVVFVRNGMVEVVYTSNSADVRIIVKEDDPVQYKKMLEHYQRTVSNRGYARND